MMCIFHLYIMLGEVLVFKYINDINPWDCIVITNCTTIGIHYIVSLTTTSVFHWIKNRS